MENNNNYSVADSRDSSPRSRDAENNTTSFIDEPPPPSAATTTTIAATATNKVKFMCSYGGRIQPRPHDNQLTYVGGDTKILAVDRHIGFPALAARLSSIAGADVCFKYQLPGEDLDALISVTNDEDLDHMMVEYDRLCRSSPRPARLRLILFPLPNTATTTTTNNKNNNNAPPLPPPSAVTKPEPQWFVDALNSVQLPEPSSCPQLPPPPVAALNPDFLFGLDKPRSSVFADPAPAAPTVPDFVAGGSDSASEAVRETEFVRHVQELQRLHLGSNNEQPPPHQRKNSQENGGVTGVEFYTQKNPEKAVHSGPVHVSGPVPVPVPVPVQGSLLHKPVGCGSGYSMPVSGTGVEPAPVYLIQTPSGIYQAVRPVGPGPVYLIQTPAAVSHPAQKVGYGGTEVGAAAERGYSQIAYAVRPQAAAAPGGDGWN